MCPYYLSQELCRWSDVVVGDYNYYFDLGALLHSLTLINQWRVCLLVDEAHNLVERGRGMYSAELDQARFKAMRRDAPKRLKSVLERVDRHWDQLHREQEVPYQVYPLAPDLLLAALGKAVSAITDLLTDQPEGNGGELLSFYHGRHAVLPPGGKLRPALAVRHQPRSRPATGAAYSTLCIRNILPAPFLGPRFEDAHSATLFSATLSPSHYYLDLLGLPEETQCLDVASPFSAEQLHVQVVRNLSTRYQHRDASLAPICQLMARQYAERPGNYLAFFSSYQYLEQVLQELRREHPQIPVWTQSRQMDEAARQGFIERFQIGGRGIGFAVLGGVFGEGVDLPGERLIGAFVATLGLAQLNPINEEIRAAHGHPVRQWLRLHLPLPRLAKGRASRRPGDPHARRPGRALPDRRPLRPPEVRRLLPTWWQVDLLRLPLQSPHTRTAARPIGNGDLSATMRPEIVEP